MPRAELGIHGLNRWTDECLEMSRKRGVHTARNGPSPPPCMAKPEMSTADRLASGEGTSRAGWLELLKALGDKRDRSLSHHRAVWFKKRSYASAIIEGHEDHQRTARNPPRKKTLCPSNMPEKRRQATSELEPPTEPPGPLCEPGAPDAAEGVILTWARSPFQGGDCGAVAPAAKWRGLVTCEGFGPGPQGPHGGSSGSSVREFDTDASHSVITSWRFTPLVSPA